MSSATDASLNEDCPDCGMTMPAAAPGGFCPRCLMGSETLGRGVGVSGGGVASFEPPTAAELDALIPGIEIEELVGRGGMGAVYKGRQARLDRPVAVKILPPLESEIESAAFDERFEREAQTMAKLSHPNIVGVFDFGETPDGMLYIVMEFVEGKNLATLIRAGEIDPKDALRWVPQMCEALEYAHENGVVHRDIKPSNMLISADGSGIKIADFGIARLAGEEAMAAARMTMTDVAVGTPDYVAPEQMRGGSDVDHRADIYSLGVMMYEMLTGQVPRGVWKAPSERNPGEPVTRDFDPIVHRAMQSEPSERYQRANEVKTDVFRIGRGSRGVGRSRWWWIAPPAAAVVALLLIVKPWEMEPVEPVVDVSQNEVIEGEILPAVADDPARPVLCFPFAAVPRNVSWDDSRNWVNGPPPGSAGESYHYHLMVGSRLSIANGGSEEAVAFGGRSLSVGAGSTLSFLNTSQGSTIAIDQLKLDGGHLRFPSTSLTLEGGQIEVLAASSLAIHEPSQDLGRVVLGADLRGSGELSFDARGGRTALVLRGRSPGFSGHWRIFGDVVASGTNSLGSGSVTAYSGRLESEDTVRLGGPLELRDSARLVLSHYWDVAAARIGGVALEPGEYRHAALVDLGLGESIRRGTGTLRVRGKWQEAEPTPPPFDVPGDAQIAEVDRAQRRGASLHQVAALWGDKAPPAVLPMRGGRLENVAPYHYIIRAGGMARTIYGSMSVDHFGGLSLTVESGGTLVQCGFDGALAVHDLRLSGGRLAADFSRAEASLQQGRFEGQLHVLEPSLVGGGFARLDEEAKPIHIAASIDGAAALLVEPGRLSAVLIESGHNDAFSGGWEVINGTLRALAPGALGTGAVEVKAGARLELLAPQECGALVVEDGAELRLEADCVFAAATIAGEDLAPGEHAIEGSRGKLIVRR